MSSLLYSTSQAACTRHLAPLLALRGLSCLSAVFTLPCDVWLQPEAPFSALYDSLPFPQGLWEPTFSNRLSQTTSICSADNLIGARSWAEEQQARGVVRALSPGGQ